MFSTLVHGIAMSAIREACHVKLCKATYFGEMAEYARLSLDLRELLDSLLEDA